MIDLPCTPRTYFDSGCHEYSTYSFDRKLIDIARSTASGHNIRKDIRYILDNYSHVSENDVHRAISDLIAATCHCKPDYRSTNTLSTDVSLFLEYLMRRYREPVDGTDSYLADNFREMTLDELNAMNGWCQATEQIEAYHMYEDGNCVAFPGDAEKIRAFHLRLEDKGCYPSYICPEPWYGNPIKSKVIILGNGARYDDFISRVQNIVFQNGGMIEEIQERVRSWWRLGNYFFNSDIYQKRFCCEIDPDMIHPMDCYNSPTYRHWLTEIRGLADYLDIPRENVYSRICVINSNAYPSVDAGPFDAGMLPSHFFLRQLVRYILTNNPEAVFVIPSSELEPTWKRILADAYTDMVAFDRVIRVKRPNRRLKLTSRALSSDDFGRLNQILQNAG